MPATPTWNVLDLGRVPLGSPCIQYTCPGCGNDAELPVLGVALAQVGHGGVVFDPGPHALPKRIRCRRCRRTFEAES